MAFIWSSGVLEPASGVPGNWFGKMQFTTPSFSFAKFFQSSKIYIWTKLVPFYNETLAYSDSESTTMSANNTRH